MASEQRDPDSQVRLAAFRQVLRQLGWTEGRNIQIDERWGAANPEILRTYVAELVGSAPDAVLAHTPPVVAAVRRETRTVPIVFVMVPAPVEIGLRKSRPARWQYHWLYPFRTDNGRKVAGGTEGDFTSC